MYQFESAAHEAAYREALAASAAQHISGRIFDASGAELIMDEDTIVGTPNIDTRCLENEDVFNIAEMYVGELNMRIKNDTVRTVELIGGEVRLSFGVDTTLGRITVPLGVWDILDAKRDDIHFIDIVGHDHMGRLAIATDLDQEVGVVSLLNMLSIIAGKANVQFAQTAAEILTMAVPGVYGSYTKWETTCWEEIRLIAQMIGGFAFANREGKIEFKKFQNYSTEASLRIPASRRFHAELKEQAFGIRQVTYTDTYGKTYEAHTTVSHRTASVICIPRNKWIWTAPDYASAESYYADICLDYIYRLDFNVVPGSIEFYGDPTIDLGDIVVLTGGIGDDANFLVTGSYWQFRAPQTLTCGGPPSVGETVTASSSAGAGATVTPASNATSTKNINTAALTPYVGALFPTDRTVARARFGCKSGTTVFLNCELTIMGTDTSNVAVSVYLDNNIQDISPKASVCKGRYTTVSFAYNALVKDGVHDIKIKASGVSELVAASGCVYGQNITSEELTYDSDYTYTIVNSKATVTGYTGSNEHIEIPEQLGGAEVTVIGGTSFADNATITTAYIPDGVQEIADSGPGIITREQTGTLPLTFDADGTDLIDWSITGAAGGVGKLGKNYLKQTEVILPSGSYGERVFTTSSWISARTSTFNSGSATTIGFNLHKADNSNITPADVGKMYIVEGNADPETEGVELSIFQGGISPKGDDNNPSVYHLMRYGDDGYGNTQQFITGQDAAYIPIRCGTALYEIKPNTTYTFTRVGGDADVEIQFTTGKGTRTISVEYINAGVPAIPDGGETTVAAAQWCKMTTSEHYYRYRLGQIPIDCRAECYGNCTAFADLKAGHYKVIAEAIVKDSSKMSTILYGDDVPYIMLIDDNNNKVLPKTEIFHSIALWNHEEYDFTLTSDTKVGLFAKAYFSGGTALVRFMIVDYDTTAESFDIVTTYGQLAGVSCWEPYSATLPLTITDGESSTTITIELDALLYADDTISLASTAVDIPTYAGSSTITADTAVQPSEMYIKYHEPVESTGAFMYATNLTYVSIPESVELIGRNAFTNTALTDVRIPRECTYYQTSFPPGCHVWYYGDEPTPDNYYTAEQVNDLLSALDARVTALEGGTI